MNLFYSIGTKAYHLLIRVSSPFNQKAKSWIDGRKNLSQQISNLKIDKPLIWFHCASLGEFEQGMPIMEEFKMTNPSWLVLVTFYSPSGFDVRKNTDVADFVFYLPVENPTNISMFLDKVKPKIAVFVKYEFWYGYMQALVQREIPLIFVSSSFRKSQIFFKPYGKWFLNQLKSVTQFFVQEQNSKDLLLQRGIEKVIVSGDTRFDRVYETMITNERLPEVEIFKGSTKVLIFGSAWQKETEFALQIINLLPPNWKVIYAPHEIDLKKMQEFENQLNCQFIRFSELIDFIGEDSKVLIVDTVGHLARIYKYGDFALVGGGFDDGIHNILEPLTFNVPVCFGPNHSGFGEAKDAMASGVGFEINSFGDFENKFNYYNRNQDELELIKVKCENFIHERRGATAIISQYINKLAKSISSQI